MKKSYAENLKDPRWQKRRLQIFDGADWQCEDCGRADKTLTVHHSFYLPGRKPWEYDDSLLISVCDNCHARRSKFEEAAHVNLARILRDTPISAIEKIAWSVIEQAINEAK